MPTYASRSLWTASAAPSFDAATLAWVAAVIANGGTVSGTREQLVDDLIVGLKDDGIWTQLDRLWLYAAENQDAAQVDLVVNAILTENSSPTFTADLGYTGNGSSAYLNSNYNPTTDAVNYAQDDACFFAWNNTAPGDAPPLASQGVLVSRLFPRFSDSGTYIGINGRLAVGTTSALGVVGHYLVNRLNNTTITFDLNGTVPLSTESVASVAIDNSTYLVFTEGLISFSSRQCCCLGIGGGLSVAERGNLYTHLRTYMTAVGVP